MTCLSSKNRESGSKFTLKVTCCVPPSPQRLQQQQEFHRLLHQHLQQPVQLLLPQRWNGLRCIWWRRVTFSVACPQGDTFQGWQCVIDLRFHLGSVVLGRHTCWVMSTSQSHGEQSELKRDERNKWSLILIYILGFSVVLWRKLGTQETGYPKRWGVVDCVRRWNGLWTWGLLR